MKRYLLLILFSTIDIHAQMGTGRLGAPVLPVNPAELITYLPQAPAGWSVGASLAVSNFTANWITSLAQREFKQNVPPPTPGATGPLPEPATITIYLTDTGYKSDYTSMVTRPQSGPPPASASYFKINNFPARSLQIGAATIILNVLIKGRYLVEIRSTNLKEDQLKKYVESLDFRKLRSRTDAGETSLPNPVILSRVDELNPQNNRSYPVYYATATAEEEK
ncbi:MAG TPA: hypothetical protein VIU12_04525 [Chryseolinea sp.]